MMDHCEGLVVPDMKKDYVGCLELECCVWKEMFL